MSGYINECLHILIKGSKEDNLMNDDYDIESSKNGLKLTTVPALEFKYKCIDDLTKVMIDAMKSSSSKKDVNYGLILTSPRAVRAVALAINSNKIQDFKPDPIFVVGDSTKQLCFELLGLRVENDSSTTGSAQSLEKYIRETYSEKSEAYREIILIHPHPPDFHSIQEFSNSVVSIQVKGVEAYEKTIVSNLTKNLVDSIDRFSVPKDTPKIMINLVFFSPSALRGYNHDEFLKILHLSYPQSKAQIKFSSIGKTTERALRKRQFEVSCVPDKPNARSLIEALKGVRYD